MTQKFSLYAVMAALCFTTSIFARQNKQDGKEYIIPFQLTGYNNLSVQAILNKQDTVHLMFHTAANALTLTEESIKRLKTVQFDGADTVKSWGGSGNSSRYSKSNSLQIGPLAWENISIWENKNSGQHTDGKFGTDLFENKVIEIDFIKNIISVSSILPAKAKKYKKHKLRSENGNLFIEAVAVIGQDTFTNSFLIHSGYSGSILFDDKFTNERALSNKLKIVAEKELKDSYGNVLKTQKAILPQFHIGSEKLTNVTVGFFAGAIGRQKMSVIGGDILKRFNIIIDAKREFIYLKPNNLRKSAYSNF
ncbi:MAG TPA: retropepsin-like aspartic protease [Flavobacterium sp.]|nr:retropepsin-like aspartic protease [Flavobacterium sp.]